jgi:hypothetical protein
MHDIAVQGMRPEATPATYSIARPDVVRAVNQRWLLKFWKRHLGAHRVPQWQAIVAENLSRISSNLSFLDVVGSAGTACFVVRFNGTMIDTVFGGADHRGRRLDEVMPPKHRDDWLVPYRLAVGCRCPIYTIHDVTDRAGRLVHYERLLLPFGRDGQCVDRILASVEFICPDGAFDDRELMLGQPAPPVLRMSARIEPQTLA